MADDHVPWFVALARRSIEEGYRVIAGRLNAVLRLVTNGVLIDAEDPGAGDSLRHADERFRRALPALRIHFELPPEDSKVRLWTLGYVNDRGNDQLYLGAGDSTWREGLDEICKLLLTGRKTWTAEHWAEFIKQPVEVHQKIWRDLLDSVAGIVHKCPECNKPLPAHDVTYDREGRAELRLCRECREAKAAATILWQVYPFKSYSMSSVGFNPVRIRPPFTRTEYHRATEVEVDLFRRCFPDLNPKEPNWDTVLGVFIGRGMPVTEDTSIHTALGIMRTMLPKVDATETTPQAEASSLPSIAPPDPVALTDMARLGRVEGAMKNWGIEDRPQPWMPQKGRQRAIFSYAELREWFMKKKPDHAHLWPADYDKAMSQIAKLSR